MEEKKNINAEEQVQSQSESQVEAEVQDEVLEVEAEELAQDEVQDETQEEGTDLEVEVAQLREKCVELQDKNLRMMAEFDNFRKRTNKEKLELMNTAGERIFKDMLPIVDDFERARQAMQNTDDINAVREGIDLIYNKFIAFLDKNNVKTIETENADFDTEFHEAITTFPAPSEELKGKIIDCTQKGYTLADKVIRFAKVVVGE